FTRAGFEVLEPRRVLAFAFFDPGTGHLFVSDIGSMAGDSIVIAAVGSPARVQISVNGDLGSSSSPNPIFVSDVTEVDIQGVVANDIFTLKGIDKPATFDGSGLSHKLVIVGD